MVRLGVEAWLKQVSCEGDQDIIAFKIFQTDLQMPFQGIIAVPSSIFPECHWFDDARTPY